MQDKPWFQHYAQGTPKTIDYQELTLPQMLERTSQQHAERTALHFVMVELSYGKLRQEVDRLAAGLVELGVQPGDRVAVQLPNMPQTVIAFYAALSIGAIVVMTNPLYTFREVEHQWKDADVQVAITADFVWDQVLKDRHGELNPRHYIVASIPDYFAFPISFLAKFKLKKQDPARWAKVTPSANVHLYKAFMKGAPARAPQVQVGLDDVALLQYTGGTTGPSKGATLTHRNISCNIQQMVSWFPGMDPGQPHHDDGLAALPRVWVDRLHGLFGVHGPTSGLGAESARHPDLGGPAGQAWGQPVPGGARHVQCLEQLAQHQQVQPHGAQRLFFGIRADQR